MSITLNLLKNEDIAVIKEYISSNPLYGHHIKMPANYSWERVGNEIDSLPTQKEITFYTISDSDKIVGLLLCILDVIRKTITIAVSIDAGSRNQGIGSESLALLIKRIPKEFPDVHFIETFVCCKNMASIKGLLNAGFDVTFIERMGFKRENIAADGIQFSLKLRPPKSDDLYSHSTMKNPIDELERLDKQSEASFKVEQDYVKNLLGSSDTKKSLLDLGCGTGAFTRALMSLNKNLQTTGVDISESFIEYAKRRHSEGEYFVSDIEKFLETTDKKFDVITSRYVITHLPKDKIQRLFDLLKQKLNDGGVFYFVTLDPDGYQTYPTTKMQQLIFKHKEMVRWKNDGYWRIGPYMPLIIRNGGLRLSSIENFYLDTDRHVSRDTFARSLGGQLIWAIEENWSDLAAFAKKDLEIWARNAESFGCVQVNAWVGSKA